MSSLPEGFTLIEDDVKTTPEGFKEVKDPDIAPDSFIGRVGQKLSDRVSDVEKASAMYSEGDIGYLELAGEGFASTIGALYDTVGEGAMTILSALTPDEAEDFLKEQIAAGGTALMDTEAAKKGLEFYDSLSDRAKMNIGNFLEIGTAALPAGKVGKTIKESGVKAEKKALSNIVLDKRPASEKIRIKEGALPSSMQRTLKREDELLNTAVSIKGVSSSNTAKANLRAVTAESLRLHRDIKKALAGEKVRLPRGTVTKRVYADLQEFLTKYPEYNTKQFRGAITAVMDSYRIGMKDKFKDSPASLLDARIRMDEALKNLKKSKELFETDGGTREIVSVVRQSLNNIIAESVPDVKVAAGLRRQHNALTMADNIADNITGQKSVVQAAANAVERHPLLTASALTGGGMFGNIMGGPAGEMLGAAAIAGGAAYGATRPVVRQTVGTALENVPVGRGTAYGVADSVQGAMQEEQQ